MADMISNERENELLNDGELENYVPVDGEVTESYADENGNSLGKAVAQVGVGALFGAGVVYVLKKGYDAGKKMFEKTELYSKHLDKKAEKMRAKLDKIELERANRKIEKEEKPEETK